MNDPERTLSEQEHVNRAAGVVGFFTLLSRILGLVRDMVVARFFGSGMAADAFFVAFRIPNLLRRLFAEGSLTIAFIPVFTQYLAQKSKKDAFQLARVTLTLLTLILAVVTLLGILFSPWIVRLQAWGFGSSGTKYDLTVLLTRITFPYILLISIVALFMGILNSLRHFGAPAASPILLNAGIIASTLWLSPYLSQPVVGVAVGVIIGGVLQVALQIPWAVKEGIPMLPCWVPRHPAVRKIGALMLPAIFGSAIYQFNQFMGTLLASFLHGGSVSWLYYADRLVQFPLGVFAIATSTAALPSFSKQVSENDLSGLRDTLGHTMRIVFFITIPSMAGLMILGSPLIQLFFERGAFDHYSTAMTYRALLYYSLGLWAFSGIRVIVSAFYAFQDTRTPVKVSVVAMAANLSSSLLLMRTSLEHGGLALALSLASTLQFCLLLFLFRRKTGALDLVPILVSGGKSLVATLIMGLCLYYLNFEWWVQGPSLGPWHLIARLFGLVTIGLGVYIAAAKILGCHELASLSDLVKPLLMGRRKR